tara:strand:+ start:4803 stop:5729 length:927 start_codon:yes stop_codon:yes gene_type:complete
MSNSTIKPIKINPELFKVSTSSNKNKTMKANKKNNFKPNLLKQDLLERIKKHRENKIQNLGNKGNHNKYEDENDCEYDNQNNKNINEYNTVVKKSFDSDSTSNIVKEERNGESKNFSITLENNSIKPPIINNDDDFTQSIDFLKNLSSKKSKSTNINSNNLSDNFPLENKHPTYGCLKNGNLPTFRQVHNTTLKASNYFENPVLNHEKPINLVNKKAVTFKYSLGKKHKFVSVLIKNASTRKNISSEHSRLKQTSLTDMKNYLKRHNLLKSGSKAPPDVIKKIYEQAILSGDIRNNNKKSLIHNYLAN